MNKLYKLIFVVLVILTGCKNVDNSNKNISQIINVFDMNIYSTDGKKLLSIKSPLSKYEKTSNSFYLEKTTIHIFNNNDTEYIINSSNSKFSNNKLLELNGNVLVKNTSEDTDELFANSFIWNISNSEYLLIGNVKFKNKTITLSSNKAILNKDNNIIEFYNPVKYIIKDSIEERSYEIESENAFYNIITRAVSFKSKEKKVRSKIFF